MADDDIPDDAEDPPTAPDDPETQKAEEPQAIQRDAAPPLDESAVARATPPLDEGETDSAANIADAPEELEELEEQIAADETPPIAADLPVLPPADDDELFAEEAARVSDVADEVHDHSELPANYFRAAGDPDEPPPPPDTSFSGQLKARADAFLQKLRPAASKLRDNSALFGAEVVSRVKNVGGKIRSPKSVREAAVWSGWAVSGFAALLVGFFVFVTWGMPSTDDLWEARQGQSITFYDRSQHVILREGAQNAPPVNLQSLPPFVPQAFIAIEDKRFYQHFGVDFGGLMRAGAQNFRAGRVVQGGSTITQQLAKNLFLSNERTWRRKAQEVAMAIWLESKFTKDEILALYLSRVYFGAGAYGIEAAAERYFDVPARQLTLLQSATLAGLVKAPSRLNPASQDIAGARARAEVVLGEMVAQGFISDSERRAAMQEELVINRRNPAGVLSYYRDWIDPLLNEVIGTQRDDFIVETTLDLAAQRAGDEALNAVLGEQGQARRVSQGALIAMDDTGGVRTMIGGRDYDQSQFNRAVQARRQPGSSFKYFIYLAAMEHGLTPWSVREDAPVSFGDWSPENYTREYRGAVTLTSAMALSLNSVAIRVSNEVGGQNVIDVAQRLGVRSPLHDYRSLALGAQEVTLIEETQAYGAMAAEGYAIQAHGIVRIRRANSNEVMWAWRPPPHTRVIEERPLRFMNYMMNRVVEGGTGTAARIPGRQLAGKTGTGNDYRDAWFIGFTPGLVAGVWVGNDNFTVTDKVTGGSLPTEIWHRYMQVALQHVPVRELQMPGPDDFDPGTPINPNAITAVGAPIGVNGQSTQPRPPDNQDRSLDFGPEG